MHTKRHVFPLMALAAAMSGQAQAAIVANDDSLTLPVAEASVITLQTLLGNDNVNGLSVPIDRVFINTGEIGGSAEYLDSRGQPANPFTSNSTADFVVLCPFSPDSGSLLVDDNGQLVYTPETADPGTDRFTYGLEEHTYNGEGYTIDGFGFATVELTLQAATAEGLTALVQGRNKQRVAASLQRLCAADPQAMGADLAARCSELTALAQANPGQIDAIIAQITPEEALALRRLASDVVRHQSDLVFRQQQARRQQDAAQDQTLGATVLELLNYQGGNAGDGAGRWSSFISVRKDDTEYGGTDLEAAFEMDTAAMMVGADYRLNADWLLGGALGWARQDLSFGQNAGDADATTYHVVGYLSRSLGDLNLDVQLGYGSGDYELFRKIAYTGVDTVAEGNTQGALYSFNMQLDWNWQRAALNLRPYLRLDYLDAQVDGYDESGGMGWAMAVGDQDMTQTTASVGLDTSYAISYRWGVLVPGLNLAVLSQASDNYSPVAFHFIGDNSSAGDFILLSEGEDSLFYQYELNLVAILSRGNSLFFSYRASASQDETEGQQINLGGRIEF